MHASPGTAYKRSSSAPARAEEKQVFAAPSTGAGLYSLVGIAAPGLEYYFTDDPNQELITQYQGHFNAWLNYQLAEIEHGTGGINVIEPIVFELCNEAVPLEDAQTPKEIVTLVRKTFALNMQQVANVLRVERPTAYAWASLEDPGKIREATKRQRLLTLLMITRQWLKDGLLPAPAIKLPLENGTTVLELMCAPELDQEAIKAAHASLAARQNSIRDKGKAETQAFMQAIAESLKGFDSPARGK